MSLEICTYHGVWPSTYKESMGQGKVFAIKQQQDVTELVNRAIIPKNSIDLTSSADLRERNIFLIYNILPGGGRSYFMKNINISASGIHVKIVGVSCSEIGGACDMNANIFVLSTPKTIEEDKFTVRNEDLDIYSEPEFDGFVDIRAIDKKIRNDFLNLSEDTQCEIEETIFQNVADLEVEVQSWFLALKEEEKEIARNYRKAVFIVHQKIHQLGQDKLNENSREIMERYGNLTDRLAQGPVINTT